MIGLEAVGGVSSTHIVMIIGSAIGIILTALKLPELYKVWGFSQKATADCKETIQLLEKELAQIKTGVNLLLVGIEDQFEDSPSMKRMVEQVKTIINKENGEDNISE